GVKFAKPDIDVNKLRAKGDKIVDMMTSSLLKGCKDRGITHVVGRGSFVDANTIQVDKGPTVKFQNCIIAVGSIPASLPIFDIGSKRILDSTSALRLEMVPKTLLVVGGGDIGLELGSVYAGPGSKGTGVEMTPGLLPGVDADLVRPWHARLRTQFEKIYLNTKITKVEEVKDAIKAHFEGEADVKEGSYEKILVAVGRRPNTANLGLDKAGVELE